MAIFLQRKIFYQRNISSCFQMISITITEILVFQYGFKRNIIYNFIINFIINTYRIDDPHSAHPWRLNKKSQRRILLSTVNKLYCELTVELTTSSLDSFLFQRTFNFLLLINLIFSFTSGDVFVIFDRVYT